MTGQDEREALVTVMGWRIPESADPWDIADAILAAGFRRPTPHVVETVAELPIAQMYESGQVAMAVADRHGQPWVLWETERGDVVGRSYLTDDEQYACEDVEGLAWPLTVLTPASAPADREAQVERVARALAESDCNDPDKIAPIGVPFWQCYADPARAALDAIEGS